MTSSSARHPAALLAGYLGAWTAWLLLRAGTDLPVWPEGVGTGLLVVATGVLGTVLAARVDPRLADGRSWPAVLAAFSGLSLISAAFLGGAYCLQADQSGSLLALGLTVDWQLLWLGSGRCTYAVDLTVLAGGVALAWVGTTRPALARPLGPALRRQVTLAVIDVVLAVAVLAWLLGALSPAAVGLLAAAVVVGTLALLPREDGVGLGLVAVGLLLAVGGLFAVQWLSRAPGVAMLWNGGPSLELGQLPMSPMPRFMLQTPALPAGLSRASADALGLYWFPDGRSHLIHVGYLIAGHVVGAVGLARLGADWRTMFARLRVR